ncbi:hypothetical protein BP5796_00823 [Coleophoma crateriformis]|uniref:Uncharacterized protein n=1 Tax=Coleophoma crateriformis TaxID=565419 RepID=A0A3D8T923_9HELO|nr:hypothetical protein BP5796_00823 [Coleophoma crateriformis]
MGKFEDFMKKLEVKPTDDEYEAISTSRWGNKDVYPIAHDKRTYDVLAFYAYWGTCGICVTSFTIGSSLIGIGLTAGQAMGAVSFVFYGTQMYFGGEAICICLSAIFPTFLRMKNTLPTSAGITTQALVGFVLFIIVYFPIIWYIPPHRIQKFLEPALIIAVATMLGIMGWAVAANHGPGNLVSPAIAITKYEAGFKMVQGITSIAGTYTGGSDRVSDWTRYAKSRHAATPAMLTCLPITVTLTALAGVITTSATTHYLGTVQWNPLIMLQGVQQTMYTPGCRAGTFFAGLGLLSVTIFVNYTQNCVSSGMDLAMLAPKYLSRRRGSIIFSILGIIAQPWRFLTQAATFITVLSSFGVFMSPAAAVLMSDFWLVRRTKWNIPELYRPGGIYWYTAGVNWRAFVAYFLGMFPALPGFVNAVGGLHVNEVWVRFYQVSYFFGYIVSGLLYWGLCTLFPPKGLGEQVDIDADVFVIQGLGDEASENEKGIPSPEVGATKME